MKARAFRRGSVIRAYSPERTTRLTGGSDWNKPFMDRCIGSAVLSAFSMLDLNSHQSIFLLLLTWVFLWIVIFFILSFVAALTTRMQIDLSFEKVPLSKRLLTIVVLSLLSALFVVLLNTAGSSEM